MRRLWPRRWRRSDVYHRLVGIETRYGVVARVDRWRGRPERERVIQDVEVPVERLREFLVWFDDDVGMRPVWLCPLRLRDPERPRARPAPGRRTRSSPAPPTSTSASGAPSRSRPGARDGDVNRAVEAEVTALGGHKSLYSDAYYDRATFERLYDVANLQRVKALTDPDDRLTGLYEKAVNRR